jgi:hypothetical protein
MKRANPTAEWIARQITEAFPWDEAPRYLIRDRDRVYGAAVNQVEANGWNNEQVHGGDVGTVITQEGAPPLAGRSRPFDHVLGDAGLSDLEAKLEQFAMDARRTTKRIVRAYPPDQRPQV